MPVLQLKIAVRHMQVILVANALLLAISSPLLLD